MSEASRIYQPGKTQRNANIQDIKAAKDYHENQRRTSWDVYDSLLQEPMWRIIGNALISGGDDVDTLMTQSQRSFQYSFRKLTPRFIFRKNLKHFVENSLRERKRNAIGIELGGTGSYLFEGFRKNFFSRTIGINLVDTRGSERRKKDDHRHHEVVKKDLLDPNTFREVKQLLNGKKADFIIERMQTGLDMLSDNPYQLSQRFAEWYQLLNDDGIFLAQIPPVLVPLMNPWVEKVKQLTSGTIDIVFASYQNRDFAVMRLIKHQGAPENIPVLSPRELRTAYLQAARRTK